MSKSKKRRYSAEEKVLILKRHLLKKEPVSDICDEIGLAPNQFYRWQKDLFDRAPDVLEKSRKKDIGKIRNLEHDVDDLKARLAHKDSVIAEVTEAYVKLKKNSGEI